jgi:hypothetical protein
MTYLEVRMDGRTYDIYSSRYRARYSYGFRRIGVRMGNRAKTLFVLMLEPYSIATPLQLFSHLKYFSYFSLFWGVGYFSSTLVI